MQKLEGVKDIETDIAGRTATFNLANKDVDYEGKLEEFAKTNEHLAGYSIN